MRIIRILTICLFSIWNVILSEYEVLASLNYTEIERKLLSNKLDNIASYSFSQIKGMESKKLKKANISRRSSSTLFDGTINGKKFDIKANLIESNLLNSSDSRFNDINLLYELEALVIDDTVYSKNEINKLMRKLAKQNDPRSKLKSLALRIRFTKPQFYKENTKHDTEMTGFNAKGSGWFWNYRYQTSNRSNATKCINKKAYYGVVISSFTCPISGFNRHETSCCNTDGDTEEQYCCAPKLKIETPKWTLAIAVLTLCVNFSIALILLVHNYYCKESKIYEQPLNRNLGTSESYLDWDVMSAENQALMKIFKTLDLDNNGYLDRGEMRAWIKTMEGVDDDLEAMDAVIMDLDQDQDGRISIQEFRRYYRSLLSMR